MFSPKYVFTMLIYGGHLSCIRASSCLINICRYCTVTNCLVKIRIVEILGTFSICTCYFGFVKLLDVRDNIYFVSEMRSFRLLVNWNFCCYEKHFSSVELKLEFLCYFVLSSRIAFGGEYPLVVSLSYFSEFIL